jgi:hypothetical protein
MSVTIGIVSLETKLPMNDADEVLSTAKELCMDDAFERSDSTASRRL